MEGTSTEKVGGDDLARALCMLLRRSWHLLMRRGNLFTKCTDTAWLGEMAAAEACLLCIRVELGMLYMHLTHGFTCMSKTTMNQVQVSCKHCRRHLCHCNRVNKIKVDW